MSILGRNVILRAIEPEDLKQIHTWGNDSELWKLLGGWHFPTSMVSTQKWVEKMEDDHQNVRLAITTEAEGLLGLANILNIDWKNKNAFHGMLLGDAAVRGKGFGLDTVMAIMRYAFDDLGLARLDGSMIEFNQASLSLYCGKCGWRQEGVQRNWYYRGGRFWDRILVGITREDYQILISETNYWQAIR